MYQVFIGKGVTDAKSVNSRSKYREEGHDKPSPKQGQKSKATDFRS